MTRSRDTANITTGSTITVASGTTVPLTITNEGTGNSFVVQDSANPDSTPFVIDASGAVAMGSGTPVGKLYVAAESATATIVSARIGTSPGGAFLTRGANGTLASPTIIANNDLTGQLVFQGYDGANWFTSSSIQGVIDATPGIADVPGRLTFNTAADGSPSATERMRINSAGNVGINTTSPAAKLDVVGSIKSDNLSGRNAIINGAFDVWQRGTSFTANSAYGPDRWFLTGTTSSMAITQVTSSLPSSFQYGIKLQRNSGVTGTDIYSIAQPFETPASIPLQGQTVTLSFWAKAGANFSATSGAGLIRLYSGTGTNQSAASQFGGWTGYSEWQTTGVFFPTATWTRFSVTGTVPSNATQIGVRVGWQAAGTAGADDSLHITGVQIETGSVATPFVRAGGTIQGELAACQRYYQRVTSDNTYDIISSLGTGVSTTVCVAPFPLNATMRTTPSAVDYSASLVISADNANNNISVTLITLVSSTPQTVNLSLAVTGATQFRPYYLYAQNSGGYVGVSAEL